MKRWTRLAGVTLMLGLMSSTFSMAQTVSDPVDQAKVDIQGLFAQWRSANGQGAVASPALNQFALTQRQKDLASGKTAYPQLAPSSYQPIYILAHGSWLMGFSMTTSGKLTAAVDVNNTLAPSSREPNRVSGIKIFMLDNNGQVIQILN